jgi:thioredoxin 1
MIAPALEEISEELADKVTIAKVDIMANTATATEFGVQSIPSSCCSRTASRSPRSWARRPRGAQGLD